MKKLLVLGVALAALTTSCGLLHKSVKAEQINLASTAWQIEKLNDKAIEAKEGAYTLVFGEGKSLSGRSNCNSMMGSFEQGENGKLTISPLASTRMACPDMKGEAEYFEAVQNATGYQVVEGELQLLKGDVVVATFKATK